MSPRLFGCVCGQFHSPGSALGMAAETVSVPVPFYVIEHPHGVAVFDTGYPEALLDPDDDYLQALRSQGLDISFAREDTVAAALERLEIDPARVRYVVCSHLHFDHVGGLHQLPNATLVVQRDEWNAGADREVAGRYFLPRRFFDLGHQLQLVEGEHDLFGDGSAVLIPSPGHTPGHQSLRVRSDQGDHILVGDACYTCEVAESRVFPEFADHAAMNRSLDKLLALRDVGTVMVFGHDPTQWGDTPVLPGSRTLMRALNVKAPWGIDAIQVVEAPDPTPGPGEVLVRMKAVSLNYRDLLMVQGMYGRGAASTSDVITPFSDGCGVVEAVGAGVTRVKPGDRVATLFFQNWISGPPQLAGLMSALGFPIPGAGAELQTFNENGVSKVPEFLTDQQVATLPCAALTAWRGLFEDARLQPGDTVVLQGTGGVSIFGLQFAHAAGLRTVITSSSDEKLARAKALGADHVVNYKATPAWSAAVREATGGRGADFIMEVGGGGTIQESMRAVRIGGHIAIIGVVAGAGDPFNPASLIGNSAKLQGLSVGSRDMFEAMCRAMALHKIGPIVDKVFPFTEARAAFAAMAGGEHFGKIVLEF